MQLMWKKKYYIRINDQELDKEMAEFRNSIHIEELQIYSLVWKRPN